MIEDAIITNHHLSFVQDPLSEYGDIQWRYQRGCWGGISFFHDGVYGGDDDDDDDDDLLDDM